MSSYSLLLFISRLRLPSVFASLVLLLVVSPPSQGFLDSFATSNCRCCSSPRRWGRTLLKKHRQEHNSKILITNLASEKAAAAVTAEGNQQQQEATFGMGCFWKPSEELLKVDGVLDTVVGYTGHPDYANNPKAKGAPTYDDVCFSREWVEGVRVFYDISRISYPELLEAFFETQEPKLGSRQYGSIIFPANERQKEQAVQWLQDNENRVRKDGVMASWTDVENASTFYRAENYHQRYWQKTRPRLAALIGLLAVGSGLFDNVIPLSLASEVRTGGNAAALIAMVYIIVERKFDKSSAKLE